MKLVNLFKNVGVGLTLWCWRCTKIELWICRPESEIEPHIHPNVESNITVLFGFPLFMRSWNYRQIHMEDWFCKSFKVKAKQVHGFNNKSKLPLIFLNVEKWPINMTKTSVSINFQEVKQ